MSKHNKKIQKYDQLLNKYKANKSLVKFDRKFKKTSANIDGYLIENQAPFLLIHKTEEFDLSGFSIIRKDQFDSVRYSKFEKAIENILLKEGVSNKNLAPKFEIDLTNWASIFSSLKKADRHVIIECEYQGDFYIGSIEKVKKKSLEFRYFDATGLLDKKPTKIRYKKITLVRFNERYIEVFRRHLRRK